MEHAKQGDTVKVNYTGKLDDGTVIDSTVQQAPIEFTLGTGQLIPGFEQAIVGMGEGEKKVVRLPPDDAFGAHRDELVGEMDKTQFPGNIQPAVGQELELIAGEADQSIPVMVTEINEATVTVDANHPLAGKEITFEIELVEIL